jgi:hypothetical protein
MFKRFALAAALFAFIGLLPSHGAASPTSPVQAAVVAQASLPPLFSAQSAAQAHWS